jgi:hypothetical protein
MNINNTLKLIKLGWSLRLHRRQLLRQDTGLGTNSKWFHCSARERPAALDPRLRWLHWLHCSSAAAGLRWPLPHPAPVKEWKEGGARRPGKGRREVLAGRQRSRHRERWGRETGGSGTGRDGEERREVEEKVWFVLFCPLMFLIIII